MKRIIIALAALGCTITASAQEIEIKQSKKEKIYKDKWASDVSVTREIADKDTTYYFMFRNARYSSIIDFEGDVLSKEELKGLVVTLYKISDEKITGDAQATIKEDFTVRRREASGGLIPPYTIYAGNGYMYITVKQILRMYDALKPELNIQ